MKKFKAVAVVMMVAIMMFSLAGCGVDMKKVSGTWTVSTINGQSAADFAASQGLPEVSVQKVYEINDKTVTLKFLGADGTTASNSGDTVVRKNGVEVTIEGVLIPLEYHEDNDTLTYKLDQAGTTYDYVLKKGSYDFDAAYQEYMNSVNGGSEEGYDEEGYDEEGYDEEGYDEEGSEDYEEE